MKRKVSPILLIVHMQEGFRSSISDEMVERTVELASKHETWHFTAEPEMFGGHSYNILPELESFVDTEIIWNWGYDPESFPSEEQPWIIKSWGEHSHTWIPEELRNWKPKEDPILVGGCYKYCLASMEAVLNHLGIDYQMELACVYN